MKSREMAEALLASPELSPLEVMIKVMRLHIAAARWDEAAAIAKDAAPYIHPRLAQIDARHSGTLTLEALVRASMEAATIAPTADPADD